jgi:NaMN:DMB phosphoribosyltransferase
MLAGAALAADELAAALAAGAAAVERCAAQGAAIGASPATCVLCVGELGIGNTTAASAVLAALTGAPPEEVCGRGTGALFPAAAAAAARCCCVNRHRLAPLLLPVLSLPWRPDCWAQPLPLPLSSACA